MAPPPIRTHDCSGYDAARKRAAALLGPEGRPPHPNLLSCGQMNSLAAICDTLLPSDGPHAGAGEDADAEFLGTSASMLGIDKTVAALLSGGMQHPKLVPLRFALWLLSTRCGTFLLCGTASLSSRFPYFQKFSSVAAGDRRKILNAWSLGSIPLLRMFFKAIKFLSVFAFFAHVNKYGENPSWKAIDYCGPDPEFVEQCRRLRDDQEDDLCTPPPLHSALLFMDCSREALLCSLQRAGFPAPVSTTSLLTIRCDAVVVGSGSGGSVVASILANAGHKVIVIEKGGCYQRTYLSLLEGPSYSEMYEGGGLLATDDIGVLFLAGSTVGGGSTVNWSASIRTPEHVAEQWRDELGLEMFGGDGYQAALDAVCRRMGVQAGVGREEGLNNEVLRRGCSALGIPVADVPINAPPDHHCGWCHLGCRDGKKQGAMETWLADVAESGNGIILPECEAVKVNFVDGGRARGVMVEFRRGQLVFAVESKVTVVSCGALNTPRLLKRSGLRNEHIGRNLYIHPVVMAWGYFPEEDNEAAMTPEKKKKSYEGNILTAMAQAVDPAVAGGHGVILQTPALHPGMFAALTPWVSAPDYRERMRRFSRTVHIFALARDRGGTGSVGEGGPTYKLDPSDEERLLEGLETAMRVLVAAGAAEVGTHRCDGVRFRPGNDAMDVVEEVRKMVRGGGGRLRDLSTPICSAHQMGSCRMGTSAAMSAVRPTGEAWEAEGLFVADSSVFPTAVGVNPMVTVMAAAYCIADHVLEFLQQFK